MSVVNIHTKKFLEAMTLPEPQRRKVLERLGAKIMEQLQVDSAPIKTSTAVAK